MGNAETIGHAYAKTDLKLENNIRELELEMGIFRYNFDFLISKVFFENQSEIIINKNFKILDFYTDQTLRTLFNLNLEVKKINSIFSDLFSPLMLNFLEKPYFRGHSYLYYDTKKLLMLLFVISNDSASSDLLSGYKFQYKKANCLFTMIISEANECNRMILNIKTHHKMREEICKTNKVRRIFLFEDKYFLNKDDHKLIVFIDILIEISVVLIIDFYITKKFLLTGSYLENMKDYKLDIKQKLIDIIFDKNCSINSYYTLIFNDINKRFQTDKFFLTSGFIRMIGYSFISEYNISREYELTEKAKSCCFLGF